MSNDDSKLFRDAVQGVAPLTTRGPAPRKPKPPPRARFTRADQQAVLLESLEPIDPAVLESGDALNFRRSNITPQTLRKLRRGEYSVHAEIDLHGLTAIETRAALSAFVQAAVQAEHTCVRIVHGKGNRSGPRGPVLKNVVNLWLQQCNVVQAFGSARAVDGGTGAVYVLLARPL